MEVEEGLVVMAAILQSDRRVILVEEVEVMAEMEVIMPEVEEDMVKQPKGVPNLAVAVVIFLLEVVIMAEVEVMETEAMLKKLEELEPAVDVMHQEGKVFVLFNIMSKE